MKTDMCSAHVTLMILWFNVLGVDFVFFSSLVFVAFQFCSWKWNWTLHWQIIIYLMFKAWHFVTFFVSHLTFCQPTIDNYVSCLCILNIFFLIKCSKSKRWWNFSTMALNTKTKTAIKWVVGKMDDLMNVHVHESKIQLFSYYTVYF